MKIKARKIVVGFPKSGTAWLYMMLFSIKKNRRITKQEVEILNNSKSSEKEVRKTHWTNLEELDYEKAVYIVRDPRAVISSVIAHWDIDNNGFQSLDFILKKMHLKRKLLTEYVLKKIRLEGNWLINNILQKFNLRVGYVFNWDEHIKIWEKAPNLIIIRYEDLLKNTFKEMEKICKELNMKITENKLKKLIKDYSFKQLKKKYPDEPHFRKGVADSWKEDLPENLRREIEKRYGEVMKKYNYF